MACQTELSDLKKVEKMKDANIPVFAQAIADGYDIIAPIPSCVLMYKQELLLMLRGRGYCQGQSALTLRIPDAQTQRLADQYRFAQPLGKVAYHVACHQRVQNFGMKTREFLPFQTRR